MIKLIKSCGCKISYESFEQFNNPFYELSAVLFDKSKITVCHGCDSKKSEDRKQIINCRINRKIKNGTY